MSAACRWWVDIHCQNRGRSYIIGFIPAVKNRTSWLSLYGKYIDNDFEKFKFEWKGKTDCLRLVQKRSTGTLRPCMDKHPMVAGWPSFCYARLMSMNMQFKDRCR